MKTVHANAMCKVAGALATLVILSGCANTSVRFYNEARDKKGQELAKAWADVKLSSYFEAMRAERTKLVAAEMEAVTERALVKRDQLAGQFLEHNLRAKSGATEEAVGVLDSLDAERIKLTNASSADLRPFVTADETWKAQRQSLASDMAGLYAGSGIRVDCDNASDEKVRQQIQAQKSESFPVILESIRKNCVAIGETERGRLLALSNQKGRVGELAAEAQEARANVDALRAQAKQQAQAFEDAARNYKQARGEPAGEGADGRIAEAAKKLRETTDALIQARDAFSQSELTSKRIDRIKAVLQALETGKTGANPSDVEILAALIPDLAPDVQTLRDSKALNPHTTLLVRMQFEQARLARAKAREQMAQRLAQLKEERLWLTAAAANRLVLVKAEMPKITNASDVSMAKYLAQPVPEGSRDKIKLVAGAMALLDVTTNELAAADRKEIEIQALEHEDVVYDAQANAELYGVLLDAITKQVSDYAAVGIKGDDIAKLVNALALLWIGRGVNQQ